MISQVVNPRSSVAGGSYIPFAGVEQARPQVKTYTLRIVGDLKNVVCTVLTALAAFSASTTAGVMSLVSLHEAAALAHAVPAFAILLLLMLLQRRGEAGERPVAPDIADVAWPAALAWPVGIALTAPVDILEPSFCALIGISAGLLATCAGIVDIVCNAVLRSRLVWPHVARNVAIYGVCPDSARVHAEILKSYGMRYAGLFEDRTPDRLPVPVATVDGGSDELFALIAGGKVDEVVITLPAVAKERMAQITRRLQQFPIDVHLCTNVGVDDAVAPGHDQVVGSIGAASLMRVQRRPMGDWGAIVKAVEDGVIGALMLIALSPLFLVIAVAIKLDSPGPVFFRQRRHGMCGQSIVVWKFRTMHVMENGGVVQQATKHDPRVTTVGRLLRITSLDELPQLLNVMLGEMSLVGPRPHAVAHDEYYASLIESYVGRHQVKPGITGWAQINGLRGETQTPEMMAKRIEFDIWYIQNWTLWLDIKILLLTPVFGLVHKNAY